MRRHVLTATTAIFGLAACSPYAYRTQTEQFATALTNVTTALDQGQASAEADRVALLRVRAGDGRARLVRTGACVMAGNDPCRLAIQHGPDSLNDVWHLYSGATASIGALRRYAESLLALTNVADRAALDKASEAVAGGVQSLVAASGVGAPYAAPARTVVSVGLWLVGEGLDYERLHRLRQAVAAAQGSVEVLGARLGQEFERLQAHRTQLLDLLSNELVGGISTQPQATARMERFDVAVRVLPTMGALQSSRPGTLAQKLISAHEKLLAALNDPSNTSREALQALQEFAAEAAALQSAFTTQP